jgi:hypothetical protein
MEEEQNEIVPTQRECTQCEGTTRAGNPCSRRTCKYFKYCWQHAQRYLRLKIALSGIEDGGLGLFATRDIAPRENIAQYTGEIKNREQFDAAPSAYGFGVNRNWIVDAVSTQSTLARWANSCRAANQRAGDCRENNAKFVVNNRTKVVWLRAKDRVIRAGEEIFVSYGRAYFE